MARYSVRDVAAGLVASRGDPAGATVVLGSDIAQATGVPSLTEVARRMCDDLALPADGQPLDRLARLFASPARRAADRDRLIARHLPREAPAPGYRHLAQLLSEGYVRVVLTTAWDSLLTDAMHRQMGGDRFRTYVRGEAPDEVIARALRAGTGPIIVKLNGDLVSRLVMSGYPTAFHPELLDAMRRLMEGLVIVLACSSEDGDLLRTLFQRDGGRRSTGTVYNVRREEHLAVDGALPAACSRLVDCTGEHVLGSTSTRIPFTYHFLTQLNLAVQLLGAAARSERRERLQGSILRGLQLGDSYVSHLAVTRMTGSLEDRVRAVDPQLVLVVDDPALSSGREIRRRLERVLHGRDVAEVSVEHRATAPARPAAEIRGPLAAARFPNPGRVLIVDAAALSGRTLGLVHDAARERYPAAEIQAAVLVVSKTLRDCRGGMGPDLPIWFAEVTDHRELVFPWGVVQATGGTIRLVGGDGPNARQVLTDRRPWGSTEVLADEEHVSVRVLTIHARERLSFQRHFCRDELFMALDDGAGIDLCWAELPRDADESDTRIASVVLRKGDHVLIPRGMWHRPKACMDRARLLEVAFGVYDQVYDLERRWDDYGRELMDGAT